MSIHIKIKIDGTLRRFLVRAGVSVLIMTISPFSGDAADIRAEDDLQETCELKETIASKAKKVKHNTADCSVTRSEETPQSIIPLDEMPPGHLFTGRTVLGEASLMAVRTKTIALAPAMTNNYRMALEEYLSLVNTLLPVPYYLYPPQLIQPHNKPFLKQTNPAAGSLASAGFIISLQEQKQSLNAKHNQQRFVNRRQMTLFPHREHEMLKKNQARINI